MRLETQSFYGRAVSLLHDYFNDGIPDKSAEWRGGRLVPIALESEAIPVAMEIIPEPPEGFDLMRTQCAGPPMLAGVPFIVDRSIPADELRLTMDGAVVATLCNFKLLGME